MAAALDMADALRATQIMAGSHTPNPELIFQGDVAPIIDDEISPDVILDLADVVVLLHTLTDLAE